jgi:hypothetical protein
MAREKSQNNGPWDELIATILQGQAAMQPTTAAMQQNTAAMQAEWREFVKLHFEMRREMDERFARIDQRLAHIEAILLEHNRILTALPDAVRDKIGFKPPQGSA